MQNIPVFTTGGGTAALILREIPHRSIAYVRLATVVDLDALLEDCAGFCRSCGAEQVFVSRGADPLPLPFAHDILLLHRDLSGLPSPRRPVDLLPIAPNNDAIYQRIINVCFRDVSNAATYEPSDIRRIYRERQKAFLALGPDGVPFGIGELHGSELAAVGILPEYRRQGLGRELVLALAGLCQGPTVELTAASDNDPALALYGGLGFTVAKKLSAWYVL